MPAPSAPPFPKPTPAADVAPRHGHTTHDYQELVAAGVDPATTQPRERSVRCVCGNDTWNDAGHCGRPPCYIVPGAVQRARRAADGAAV